MLSVDELRAARARARELGAVIVSDECYAELGWDGAWADEPVPSLLDPRVTDGDHHHTLAIYSLSKQSNMAGYRAAFVAGCRESIARLTNVRKHAGLMLPAPAPGGDGRPPSATTSTSPSRRQRYRARRDLLRPALEAAGFRIDRSEGGLYLWATEGRDAWDSIARLADLGILGGPGHFYGVHFPEHVRLSLTATDERIAAAAARLQRLRAVLTRPPVATANGRPDLLVDATVCPEHV